MDRPKTVAEMAAEFLREVGVLVLVFYPVESLFLKIELPAWSPRVFWIGIAGGAMSVVAGMAIERVRHRLE